MKTLLILAACLAFVACERECGPLERVKVKSEWTRVYGLASKERVAFGRDLWDYVLEKEPKIKDILSRVRADNMYSSDFSAHIVRVFGGLDICISLLQDEETLNSQLSHLHDQHNERGIPHEYFDIILDGLVHAIPKHSEHFDQDAWAACYKVIRNGITKGLTE
ncbi:hypothetical protein LSH36_193g10017 [Paralvinella palmiformis]|uniref:Extracellular globin n=1 Tax=Paralvinella palmiformis TaxID=53620 RepID=A0AAD9N523_9ANNE|nr:hypothetical protein LSH36_193g10017 [Paralvinella palmiformis]